MRRDSFVFYTSWIESIDAFTEEQQAEIIFALVRYCAFGIEPDLSKPYVKMAYLMNKTSIDRNYHRYVKRAQKNDHETTKGQPMDDQRSTSGEPVDDQCKGVYVYDDVYVYDNPSEDKSSSDVCVARARARRTQPTPSKKNDLDIPDDASDEYKKFIPWVMKIAPHFFNGCEHIITQTQMEKLVNGFGKDQFFDIFSKIENRKDLRKRYTNMYLTTLNWLKKERDNENE